MDAYLTEITYPYIHILKTNKTIRTMLTSVNNVQYTYYQFKYKLFIDIEYEW